jgi:bifunctional enzyme CysN/CysC
MGITRLVVCGSVDDGKSTVIGRLLYETDSVPADTLNLARTTRRSGSIVPSGEIDFSLLTDGLEAERQQGITIDVAFRSIDLFEGNRLLIADSPGHQQYTRNMVVAASNANIALLILDASKGMTTQTRRHLAICSVLEIKKIIVAINKMDLIEYSSSKFHNISEDIRLFCDQFGFEELELIPMCAINGANVTTNHSNMDWYSGPSLLSSLQECNQQSQDLISPRLQIQNVIRSTDFRGVSGRIREGNFKIGNEVLVLPSLQAAVISGIIKNFTEVKEAFAGESVSLILDPEVDAARGDLIVLKNDPIGEITTKIRASLIWLDESDLVLNRSYILIQGSKQIPVFVVKIFDKLNVENPLSPIFNQIVKKNDVANVEIVVEKEFNCSLYSESKNFGSFMLIDRSSFNTVGAGVISERVLNQGKNFKFDYEISMREKEIQRNQKSKVIWLTGISGSGKSTIANELEKTLFAMGRYSIVLDGDNLRSGLNKDLGFSESDRAENIRRVSEVAKILFENGSIVIVATISAFESDRTSAREIFPDDSFNLVWVNTPMEVCRQRDTKGLYKQANEDLNNNLTGVGQAFEIPLNCDLELNGSDDLGKNIQKILSIL